jgi:hypothetical protein
MAGVTSTLARMPKYPSDELSVVRDDVRARARALGRVFRRRDLVEWGLPGDTVLPMRRRQWWVRLHHGVYTDARDIEASPNSPANHLLNVAAAIRALDEPAYAFGASAALLHGLSLPRGRAGAVHLVRPLGSEGRSLSRRISAPDRLMSSAITTYRLRPEDVTEVSGIPTVSPALAAVSAAVGCPPDWAVAVMDSAAWQAPTRIEEMALHAARLQHLAGIGPVRAAVPHVRSGAQTPLESHSRLRLVRLGLPEPRLQVPYYDEDGLIGYVDMDFEELGVIGEADGMMKYRTGQDLIAEKQREDRLRRQKPVVRWDWRRMWHDPEWIARRLYESARWRRAG